MSWGSNHTCNSCERLKWNPLFKKILIFKPTVCYSSYLPLISHSIWLTRNVFTRYTVSYSYSCMHAQTEFSKFSTTQSPDFSIFHLGYDHGPAVAWQILAMNCNGEQMNRPRESSKQFSVFSVSMNFLWIFPIENYDVNWMCPSKWPSNAHSYVQNCKKFWIDVMDQAY